MKRTPHCPTLLAASSPIHVPEPNFWARRESLELTPPSAPSVSATPTVPACACFFPGLCPFLNPPSWTLKICKQNACLNFSQPNFLFYKNLTLIPKGNFQEQSLLTSPAPPLTLCCPLRRDWTVFLLATTKAHRQGPLLTPSHPRRLNNGSSHRVRLPCHILPLFARHCDLRQ